MRKTAFPNMTGTFRVTRVLHTSTNRENPSQEVVVEYEYSYTTYDGTLVEVGCGKTKAGKDKKPRTDTVWVRLGTCQEGDVVTLEMGLRQTERFMTIATKYDATGKSRATLVPASKNDLGFWVSVYDWHALKDPVVVNGS